MEYRFEKIATDKYKLVYKNSKSKEIEKEFTRTNEYRQKIDKINKTARIELSLDLTEMGKKIDNFIIITKDDKGHTYRDESNYKQLEQGYIEDVTLRVIDEILSKAMGMSTVELFKDMGIDINNATVEDSQEIMMFISKFTTIITGNDNDSPSEEEQDNN